MSLPTNSVHALLLTWNYAAVFYNTFYVCAKSGLGWSNMWVGTTNPSLAWDFDETGSRRWHVSPPHTCSEISGLKPCFWLWGGRRCCSLVSLSRADALFSLSFLLSRGLFLLSTSIRSNKDWSWGFYSYWLLWLAFSVAFVTLTLSSSFCNSVDKKWDL